MLPPLLAQLALLAPVSAAVDPPFKIVLLPDTQHYTDSALNIFHFDAQTQWIADNVTAEGLVLTTMVGDLVENGAEGPTLNQVEWDRALAAMARLDGDLLAEPDGLLPYSTVPGNHDYDVVDQKGPATQYLAHFGPGRYAGRSWFESSSAGGTNMAQIVPTPGGPLLHLGLELYPHDDALAWAQSILAANPTLPAALTTHHYLADVGRSNQGGTHSSAGDNSGEDLYRKLVEPFPQVFLVLGGHVFGNAHFAPTTALGQTVHEVLADFQQDPNGGNGWMQTLEFRPDEDVIEFAVHSPTYMPGVTLGPNRALDPSANFTVSYDLRAHRVALAQAAILRFRNGQDFGHGPYTGSVDTYLGDGSVGTTLPNVPQGTSDPLVIDSGGDDEQALMRFDGIVGAAPGQIPPGASIAQAILTLTSEGLHADSDEGASFHRMWVGWDGSSTWNTLVGGVQLGVEADPVAEASSFGLVSERGTASIDVTASVQAWADGASNLGWVFMANSTDAWRPHASETLAVVERPMLTVVLAAPPPATSYCTAGTSASGCRATLSATGLASASAPSGFTLSAASVEGGAAGVFFFGANGRQANPWGSGTSYQCVVPPVRRAGLLPSTGTPGLCDGAFAEDLNALWCPSCPKPNKNPLPGSVQQAQLWYRDPLNTSNQTTSLSDAVEFVVCP
jgi:hypothetical protein